MAWNLEEALAYYKKQGAPRDQTALISLLKEISREHGGAIPSGILSLAADYYGVKETFLQAIVKRIPGLRISDTHLLELCAGPNCGKHTALAKAAEALCREHHVSLKFVPCMRQCGKGPNIRWDGKLYNRADEALIRELTAVARKKTTTPSK